MSYQITKFQGFKVSKFRIFKNPRFQDRKIPRFHDSKIARFQDSKTAKESELENKTNSACEFSKLFVFKLMKHMASNNFDFEDVDSIVLNKFGMFLVRLEMIPQK